MSLELDAAYRVALFEHVAHLRRESDSRIAAERLNLGMTFRGERVPIWSQQKGIFRPRILRDPGAATAIQTSFDGPYDDSGLAPGGALSYRYRGTDPGQSDNVAMRRAMELGRPLLYLVAIEQGVYEPVFPCYVIGENPKARAFDIVASSQGYRANVEASRVATDLEKSYATREVLQRLHQGRFRSSVLNAYATQCAVCRLRHGSLLDAAHIIEDRVESSRPEVPNGLALCKIHHGAYDAYILGITPDRKIEIRQDVLDEHDGPMLLYGLQAMHGVTLHVPRAAANRPSADYLSIRYERFRAA